MSTIVIMPGGFHPFHAGHADLYQQAKKAFPGADIYVAATNDQSERPFPFALKEKLAKLAGVESGHFVQVKSPFQAKEITQHYNPEQDVLIFVRSEKDRNEPPKPGGTKKDGSPAYFQPYTGKDLQPFSQHAYIDYLKTVEFGPGITSATQIRNAWPTLNDKRKTALVMSLYPAAQKNVKLAKNVVGMFDQVMGGQEVTEASYMSLDDYKNNLQKALPSIIEYYQDELGFMPSKEQLASAVKAAHATMERTGDTEQAGESLDAVLDSFVPSNSSNKNSPKIDFKKNLLQVLQQKYPDAEFKIGPDRVESIDGQLSVIADTEQEGKYVGCFMWDVSTGPYKGALGIAIKKTTDQLLQANPGKKPALFISGDNQNPEAWSHIAKKLKYKLITDENTQGVAEGAGLSVEQLAHISDKALDDAYHYGRSTPGANFGWMANLQSAKAAKRLIDAGETDIEVISDAIHKGWNVTAAADYKGQLQLDTPTPEDKKLKRAKLAMQSYSQLPEEEKEKDRVVARALLTALRGKIDETQGLPYPSTYGQETEPLKSHGARRIVAMTNEDSNMSKSLDYLEEK